MAKYKIADIVVEMKQEFEETAYWYKPYLYNGEDEPVFTLEADPKRMDYLVKNGVDITPPIAENMVLCTDFNRKLLKYYGTYLHSSAMLFEGKAYLFSATSGTGKSTHTQKWIKRFGDDKVKIINDDKPSFRLIDGKCIVYGSPFAGGTDVQENISAELGALVFIERSETNSIEKIPPSRSVSMLISQSPKSLSEKSGDRQLEIYSEILTKYPVYLLRCNLDDEAVDVAMGILN